MALNPAAFELITFDCYGTLVDWETGILSAMHPVLERHEVHASADEILQAYARAESAAEMGAYSAYAEVLRRTFTGMARDLGFAPRGDEIDTLIESLLTWRVFADTNAALASLSTRYRLGIISNVDDALLAQTRTQFEVEFDVVLTAEQVGAYKPSLEVFEAALEAGREITGGDRSKWLHVGSSKYHDIEPARSFGVACVHVARDSGRESCTPDVEDSVHADHDVADLAGLWTWMRDGAA